MNCFISKPNYKRATNMAYEVLSAFKELKTPVDVFRIISSNKDIKIKSYKKACEDCGMDLQDFLSLGVSEHGFTFMSKGKAIILYNSDKDILTIRFTIAHELGHIYLEHSGDCLSANKEANFFARNLLCPISVVEHMGLESVDEYCSFFHVSEPMATVAIDYQQLDKTLVDGELYSKTETLFFQFYYSELIGF